MCRRRKSVTTGRTNKRTDSRSPIYPNLFLVEVCKSYQKLTLIFFLYISCKSTFFPLWSVFIKKKPPNLFFSFHFLHISLFRFVLVDFVLLSLVSFRFVFISLISFRFRWFRFVSFLFRFALFRYPYAHICPFKMHLIGITHIQLRYELFKSEINSPIRHFLTLTCAGTVYTSIYKCFRDMYVFSSR